MPSGDDDDKASGRFRAVCGLVLVMMLASCGSDDSDSAPSGTTGSLQSCPFSGTTEPTQGTAAASGSAAVSKVETSKSGCIDNIAFAFSTLPSSWTVAYSDGPFTDASTGASVSVAGPVTLVVTFADASYTSGGTPATLPPKDLSYVTAIDVTAGPNGSLEWIISLPDRAEYQTSLSNVPPNFTLAIG